MLGQRAWQLEGTTALGMMVREVALFANESQAVAVS